MKLKDIAHIERAKKGKIYPKYSTIIQISATKGQVEYTKQEGEVKTHYAVVLPHEDYPPLYLYLMIETFMPHFYHKYSVGLNIKAHEIGEMEIQLCQKNKMQDIHDFFIESSKLLEQVERKIDALQDLKKEQLDALFI